MGDRFAENSHYECLMMVFYFRLWLRSYRPTILKYFKTFWHVHICARSQNDKCAGKKSTPIYFEIYVLLPLIFLHYCHFLSVFFDSRCQKMDLLLFILLNLNRYQLTNATGWACWKKPKQTRPIFYSAHDDFLLGYLNKIIS